LTDTEKEDSTASDAQGRPCTFSPSHDECHDQHLEDTNNLPALPKGQHYGDVKKEGIITTWRAIFLTMTGHQIHDDV
jgi:hypothetical protein